VKKKNFATPKDKKDWFAFTKQMGNVRSKAVDNVTKDINENIVKKLDLHGVSLSDAKEIVKKFVIESYDKGYRKLLIVTGKGSRSKSYNNPYLSSELSVLKNYIPEYVKNDEDLNNIINKTSKADLRDGGEGAIYLFLKKKL